MEKDQRYVTEARYGALLHRAEFWTTNPDLARGARCVLRTERGVETGIVTRDAVPLAADARPPPGEVLREMQGEDERRARDLAARALTEHRAFCEERIRKLGLVMKLVHVEQLFGGGRIIFYFTADGRVDFRELVKDLARRFRTRIELRQIGVRDEARILGDQEYCGRDLCCTSWMREILPVTMRMAKNQKSTLDPNKISGRCGRLKCCLRFEDETYRRSRARLPRPGARVTTPAGPGKVVAVDALAATVTVLLGGADRAVFPAAEVGRKDGGEGGSGTA